MPLGMLSCWIDCEVTTVSKKRLKVVSNGRNIFVDGFINLHELQFHVLYFTE
jgi:hypothetical protein